MQVFHPAWYMLCFSALKQCFRLPKSNKVLFRSFTSMSLSHSSNTIRRLSSQNNRIKESTRTYVGSRYSSDMFSTFPPIIVFHWLFFIKHINTLRMHSTFLKFLMHIVEHQNGPSSSTPKSCPTHSHRHCKQNQ
jgi:uncharacterized membrane protein (DUF106 family)